MEYSCVQLNDLPDEILMIIFKKLANSEVLYSLLGVNKRLNKIAHDSVFTNDLSLLTFTWDGLVYSLPDPILDRFCLHILPKIHQNIKWLHLDSQSMERILRATNYPNLYGISFYNIEAKTTLGLFTDETSVIHPMKNQILSLVIDISTNEPETFISYDNDIVFTRIFNTFTNLQCLNFDPSSIWHQRLPVFSPPPRVISTNLLELHVSLKNLTDCLYLLDGRFNQLRTFYVDICYISVGRVKFKNTKKLPTLKLPTLKCFSLFCEKGTDDYDKLVLPLLHRMSNLEKLDLCLFVCERKRFFDGNDLKMNIINHMPQLNKFIFNIRSLSSFYNEINLPGNEDIQKTFIEFNDKQIIYCADYFPKEERGYCHIYSYPYKCKIYHGITNNFPGGIFQNVRKVSLSDERPFEHEFFLQITRSFPFMEKLSVCNETRQINKRFQNENRDLSIIKYPNLKQLDLIDTCIDYYKQFLFDNKTCLPFDIRVAMSYELVKKVTRNFTRNRTRCNCAKINFIRLLTQIEYVVNRDKFSVGKEQLLEHIKDYFPRTQID